MPSRPKFLCRNCKKIIDQSGYCDECKPKFQRIADQRRGSAASRGYDYQWQKYSRWFLSQPDNQFCKICGGLAECVDHIIPVKGKDDINFWDKDNHQSLCLSCNSRKSNRIMRGER